MNDMNALSPVSGSEWRKWLRERLIPVEASAFESEPRRTPPDTLAPGLELDHLALPLASGIGLALAACRPAKRDPAKALVLLLHGLGDDAAFPQWHWIEALTERGFLVLSMEWDGHGPGGPSSLDPQEAARSLPLVLQKLYGTPGEPVFRRDRPGPACALLGQGMGALYALLASVRPDVASVVEAVVCVAPTLALDPSSPLRRRFGEPLWPGRWLSAALSSARIYGIRDALAALRVGRRRRTPRVRLRLGVDPFDQLRRFLRQTIDAQEIAEAVRVPTLCLFGGRDPLVPLLAAQRRLASCRSGLFVHVDPFRTHHSLPLSPKSVELACSFLETKRTSPDGSVTL